MEEAAGDGRSALLRVRRPLALAAWALGTYAPLFSGGLRDSPAVLWPSLAAVVLAFVTREIYSSLFLGALAGSILLYGSDSGVNLLDLVLQLFLQSGMRIPKIKSI